MITSITLIILLPLLNFLFGMLFSQFVGKCFYFISTINIIVCFLISILFLTFYCLLFDITSTESIYIYSSLNLYLLHIDFCFRVNNFTVITLFIINFISSLVHMYSIEYIENDTHFTKFISYSSLFTFFTTMLVITNNRF